MNKIQEEDGLIRTKDLTFAALLVAVAIVLSILENLLPPLFFFAPGAKIGLANIVTLIALYVLGPKPSLIIILVRTSLTALIVGNLTSFMYSLAGALLSWLAMLSLKALAKERVSIIGLSVFGALAFNLGQLMLASLLTQSWLTFNYLPYLSIAGIIAGFLTGILAHFLLQALAKTGRGLNE